jgi:hypothetical protein
MQFILYISFKDNNKKENIRIESSDILHLYEEMKYSETYGISSELINFSPFEEFRDKLYSLNIGQTKYVLRARIGLQSYTVSVKKIY